MELLVDSTRTSSRDKQEEQSTKAIPWQLVPWIAEEALAHFEPCEALSVYTLSGHLESFATYEFRPTACKSEWNTWVGIGSPSGIERFIASPSAPFDLLVTFGSDPLSVPVRTAYGSDPPELYAETLDDTFAPLEAAIAEIQEGRLVRSAEFMKLARQVVEQNKPPDSVAAWSERLAEDAWEVDD